MDPLRPILILGVFNSNYFNGNIPILKVEIHTVILIQLWLCPGGGGGVHMGPRWPTDFYYLAESSHSNIVACSEMSSLFHLVYYKPTWMLGNQGLVFWNKLIPPSRCRHNSSTLHYLSSSCSFPNYSLNQWQKESITMHLISDYVVLQKYIVFCDLFSLLGDSVSIPMRIIFKVTPSYMVYYM